VATQYTPGASIVSMDGYDIGTLERIDEDGLIVRLHEDQRLMRVPFDVIDEAASTEDRILIQGAVTDHERSGGAAPGAGDTLPLVAEEAIAHVREVDRGKLVIDKRVEVVPHRANVDVGTDRVEIERIPVNEELDTPPETRQEGDTLIVPVVEEILVIAKRYRVVEEIHIRKFRDVETRTFEEDLKREVVDIQEVDEEGAPVKR